MGADSALSPVPGTAGELRAKSGCASRLRFGLNGGGKSACGVLSSCYGTCMEYEGLRKRPFLGPWSWSLAAQTQMYAGEYVRARGRFASSPTRAGRRPEASGLGCLHGRLLLVDLHPIVGRRRRLHFAGRRHDGHWSRTHATRTRREHTRAARADHSGGHRRRRHLCRWSCDHAVAKHRHRKVSRQWLERLRAQRHPCQVGLVHNEAKVETASCAAPVNAVAEAAHVICQRRRPQSWCWYRGRRRCWHRHP
mmetsp:Transcript_73594/g.209578  ORF Transcript_73594/g.209578 Transcript_73594/m.209578 type:complete len:251 (-) Transcript_73594:121-873(-)